MSVLSLKSLGELRDALIEAFAFIQNLQKTKPIARFIKTVQVPSVFSESLCVHLLQNGLILPELQSATFSIGGAADIVALHQGKALRIEVKATGDKGFQRLGPKDLAADYLVWIHFNFFFRGEADKPLMVWTVQKPGRFFAAPGILTVEQFKARTAAERVDHLIAFDTLK